MKALRLLALYVSLLCAAQGHASPYEAQLLEFESFARKQMELSPMAGLSVAVMKGDFVWTRGFGYADLENSVSATPDSSYRLASVTKPMTAVAVLKLAEQGRIDLDAEVQRYVPTFPKKAWPITIRQLLAHLGGISHYRDASAEMHFREPKTTEESLAVFCDFELVAEPGTRVNYSSYGYVLLGAVLEGATGKSYGDVMRETVWGPLGMSSTVVDDARAIIPNRVRGYEVMNGRLRNAEFVDVSSRFAAGGTRSTVVDMISFVKGIAEGNVLSQATIDTMWTPQKTRNGQMVNWGLGWDLTPLAGRFRVYHSGSQPETETYLVYVPRERFAIAMATNVQGAKLQTLADRLAEIFLGDDWPQRPAIRGTDEERQAGQAVIAAFQHGLAFYERHGRSAAPGPQRLAGAFAALNGTLSGQQASREQLIVIGSHIAQSLATRGLQRYRSEGAFAFVDDYTGSPRLSAPIAELVRRWRSDWKRTGSIRDVAELVNAGTALENATVVPDFSGSLVASAQQSAMRGNIPESLRLAKLAASLYPGDADPHGLLGMLLIMTGDVAAGEQLVRKSAAIDPNGYAGPENILRVASFLAGGPARPAAMAILSIAAGLYPEHPGVAKALAQLRGK